MKPSALALALFAPLAACGGAGSARLDGGAGSDVAQGADYYAPPGYSLVPFRSAGGRHSFPAAEMVLEPGRDYLAVLDTTAGRIVLDLLEAQTPTTVNSFAFLALNHYFDGIAFHRVIEGFVAQGGDPNTLAADRGQWGTGGPGYRFGLEIVAQLKFNAAGVVGMARSMDPNSNGSQFFITLGPAANLDGQYTIFARVVEGQEALPRVARGMPPQTPTRMSRVWIVAR